MSFVRCGMEAGGFPSVCCAGVCVEGERMVRVEFEDGVWTGQAENMGQTGRARLRMSSAHPFDAMSCCFWMEAGRVGVNGATKVTLRGEERKEYEWSVGW